MRNSSTGLPYSISESRKAFCEEKIFFTSKFSHYGGILDFAIIRARLAEKQMVPFFNSETGKYNYSAMYQILAPQELVNRGITAIFAEELTEVGNVFGKPRIFNSMENGLEGQLKLDDYLHATPAEDIRYWCLNMARNGVDGEAYYKAIIGKFKKRYSVETLKSYLIDIKRERGLESNPAVLANLDKFISFLRQSIDSRLASNKEGEALNVSIAGAVTEGAVSVSEVGLFANRDDDEQTAAITTPGYAEEGEISSISEIKLADEEWNSRLGCSLL